MAIVVQKFGGTSVGSIDRIRYVAKRIKSEVESGNLVAVVVSAMAGTTDHLVDLVSQVSTSHDGSEHDVVVSSGEQITCGLLALMLQSMDISARSWMAWQLPIKSQGPFSCSTIQDIDKEQLLDHMRRGEVAIIPGFQAINNESRITTLGRGGSDTSAVALAAALDADRCDIFTDIDGVYTADPRIVKNARKLEKITFAEMLELSSVGAKVLHTRSVAIAKNHNIKLRVLSAFEDLSGTIIVNERTVMENNIVTGVALQKNMIHASFNKINFEQIESLLMTLSSNNIAIDFYHQQEHSVSFLCNKNDFVRLENAREKEPLIKGLIPMIEKNLAQVSAIGAGIKSNGHIIHTFLKGLKTCNIFIDNLSATEVKVSAIIKEENADNTLVTLHDTFGLGERPNI